MDNMIEARKRVIEKIDIIDDVMGLDEAEVMQRNEERALLFRDTKCKASLLSKKNQEIGGSEKEMLTRVSSINTSIKGGSATRQLESTLMEFGEKKWQRRALAVDNQMLTTEFMVEEIKDVIDSCESYKSQGPDGFNFGFLKNFWEIFRDDFIRLMGDFY
ncbi:hypothetical protein ACS0TY_028123 [Phlomoides rotata]